MAAVRYIVSDLDSALLFYTLQLGFTLEKRYGDAMAIVKNGDAQLWLAGPASSAAQALPNGQKPEPGGWSRMVLAVAGLDPILKRLDANGVDLKGPVTIGPGGRHVLLEDPSGNLVELFEPA